MKGDFPPCEYLLLQIKQKKGIHMIQLIKQVHSSGDSHYFYIYAKKEAITKTKYYNEFFCALQI